MEINMKISFKKLTTTARKPYQKTEGAAGFDLYADEGVTIAPGQCEKVVTNIGMEIPAGYAAYVVPRSGLARDEGVTVLNAPGLIDSDYRGSIDVLLVNHGAQGVVITPGDRIAQLVIQRVFSPELVEVAELAETVRGAGGFGSTGKA